MSPPRKTIAKSIHTNISTIHNIENYEPLHKDIFYGAKYNLFDPSSCIPFAKIRSISQSGVKRLISLYDKSSSQPDGQDTTVIAHGSDKAIAMPLNGSLQHIVYIFLRRE